MLPVRMFHNGSGILGVNRYIAIRTRLIEAELAVERDIGIEPVL